MLNTIIKLLVIVVLAQWIYIHAVQTIWVHEDILMELDFRSWDYDVKDTFNDELKDRKIAE